MSRESSVVSRQSSVTKSTTVPAADVCIDTARNFPALSRGGNLRQLVPVSRGVRGQRLRSADSHTAVGHGWRNSDLNLGTGAAVRNLNIRQSSAHRQDKLFLNQLWLDEYESYDSKLALSWG